MLLMLERLGMMMMMTIIEKRNVNTWKDWRRVCGVYGLGACLLASSTWAWRYIAWTEWMDTPNIVAGVIYLFFAYA